MISLVLAARAMVISLDESRLKEDNAEVFMAKKNYRKVIVFVVIDGVFA